VNAQHVRLDLIENEFINLQSPELEVAGGRLDIRLEVPWLYPPAAHPYWDRFSPADARERQTLFRIDWGPASVSAHSIHSADPVAFGPAVATRPEAEPGSPYVESIGPAAPRP
jgi:hypothetical protein